MSKKRTWKFFRPDDTCLIVDFNISPGSPPSYDDPGRPHETEVLKVTGQDGAVIQVSEAEEQAIKDDIDQNYECSEEAERADYLLEQEYERRRMERDQ